MNLEDLRLFVATLDLGSFTAAADRLGVSKQYVSRRTMALEESLGVRLLNRTTRRLSPTELGVLLYERAAKILEEFDETQELLSSRSATPRGALRISAPMTFGTLHVSPLLAEFMRRYPMIRLEVDLNDRAVDLVGEGYDMSIRVGVLEDSTLIARRLTSIRVVACASPDYLARRPAPSHPRELVDHDCLLYGHSRHVEWRFIERGKPLLVALQGNLRANNGEVIRDAAVGGRGIALLPTFILGEALKTGALVPVLEDFLPQEETVYAVYPQHRLASRVVQLFVEYLRECLR